MPGWDSKGIPKAMQDYPENQDEELQKHRRSLGRHSAPVGDLSPRQPLQASAGLDRQSVDPASRNHSGGMWSKVRKVATKGGKGSGGDAPQSKWWQMFESAHYNEPFEERPAHWKSGSYVPQFDTARKATEAAGAGDEPT
ncbi:hypothetical protein WJX72_007835 [[Myrmecia] bisecta]|uniref:Uncharacterized protein n=1 Tax=[Myrmecia] bisecta TaxID=41462 RepID=A0AAW1Q4M2_9CHLO